MFENLNLTKSKDLVDKKKESQGLEDSVLDEIDNIFNI